MSKKGGEWELYNMAEDRTEVHDLSAKETEKVAELKEQYGFPLHCGTNYAKNTVKHLRKIVETWVGAGIVTKVIE